MLQDLEHVIRVAQIGHPPDRAGLAREQRGRQNRQGRILRTADLDRTAQRMSSVDPNLIHIWLTENAGYLNNPFSIQCRDNSFDEESRKVLHPGQAQFPMPGVRPA